MVPSLHRASFKSYSSEYGLTDDETAFGEYSRALPSQSRIAQNLEYALQFFLNTEDIQRVMLAKDRFQVTCIAEAARQRHTAIVEQEAWKKDKDRAMKLRDIQVPEERRVEWTENMQIPAAQLGHVEEKPVKKKPTHEENLQVLFRQRMLSKE